MGILDKFKKGKKDTKETSEKSEEKVLKSSEKSVKKVVKKAVKKDTSAKESSKQPNKVKKQDAGNAHRVLVRPLVTEKSTELANQGKFIFEVYLTANKIEITKAIQSLYGVNPVKVNIIKVGGKAVNFGRVSGKRKNFKKAIVTLRKGERIEVFEGV